MSGLSDDLPVGRRMAYWRRRRGMSQQVFADRLGRSKSWVDKCERGIRQLDKVSVLREIADTLRISLPQLVGTPIQSGDRMRSRADVEAVRAALTRYEVRLGRRPETVPDVEGLERAVGHAWMALARADYEWLLRGLPGLVTGGQWCRAEHSEDWRAALLLGQLYQIAAEVLQRTGAHDLGWLAADRAMAVSADAGDPLWAARAAGPLAAVLRETGRSRHAFEVCVASAHRIAGRDPLDGAPEYLAVYGTLLLHAATAAAALHHPASARELLHQARAAATAAGTPRDPYRTGFGPALVGVVGVAVQVELGNGSAAVDQAARFADEDRQQLPPAVRAAYLVEVARAHLQVGDAVAAGRAVVAADRTAAAEVRVRPAAREVLGAALRGSSRPEQPVIQLAEAIGVTP